MTMERDPRFISSLQLLLEEECKLHHEYIEVLTQERDALTKFDEPRVAKLSARRSELCESMAKIQQRRAAFMGQFPDAESKKLSELIVKYCDPEDARKLSPLVRKLKALVTKSRNLANEFNQVVDFSLTLVNGTMSILWSATQTVTRSYSKKGTIRESFQPGKSEGLRRV